MLQEEKSNYQSYPATNNASYYMDYMDISASYTHWGNRGTNVIGITSYLLLIFKGHSLRCNPYMTLLIRPIPEVK